MGIHFQDGEDMAIQQRGLSAALVKECIRSLFHVRILRQSGRDAGSSAIYH